MNKTTEADLQKLAERWISQGWQNGNPDIVDSLHSPAFIDHDPAGRTADRDGFKKGIIELYAAFPDFHCTLKDLVTDVSSGKVAIRWTAAGTHRGLFLGFQPTDQVIHFKGIEIIRIEQGLIVERWGEWDGLGLFQQLQSYEELMP